MTATIPQYGPGTQQPEKWAPRAAPVGTHLRPGLPSLERAWVTDANAGLDVTQVPSQLSIVAWTWQCPHGHLWRESLNSMLKPHRTKPRWKQLLGTGVAACRACAIEQYGNRHTCGHPSQDLRDLNDPPASAPGPCPACAPRQQQRPPAPAQRRTPTAQPPERSPYKLAQATFTHAQAAKKRKWPTTASVVAESVGQRRSLSHTANDYTSQDERRARQHLTNAGLPVKRYRIVVPDLIADDGSTWTLTPDAVIGDIAVEIDSPSRRGGGPSHNDLGWPAEDTYRDDCLRAAGMRPLRVRLGGLPQVPDTVCVMRDGGMTVEVLRLLEAAVRDLTAGSPVQQVQRAAAPAHRTQPKSPLSSVWASKYHDGHHGMKWTTPEGTQLRFDLRGYGRFLYVAEAHVPGQGGSTRGRFVMEVGLDRVPRQQWRRRLLELLPDLDLSQGPGPGGCWSELPWAGADVFEAQRHGALVTGTGWSAPTRDPAEVLDLWISYDDPAGLRGLNVWLDPELAAITWTPAGAAEPNPLLTVGVDEGLVEVGYFVSEVAATRTGAQVRLRLDPRSADDEAAEVDA